MKVLKDTPIAEINLRRYEKPYNLSKRELIKKMCLSLGLLQPGDSRDVIVDVFYILMNEKKELSSEDIASKVIEFRKSEKLPMIGIASSNIRRQIKRLRDVHVVEKVKTSYRISENDSLGNIVEEKIERIFLPQILSRVKEYARTVDEVFRKNN